jgi:hypothetical protein
LSRPLGPWACALALAAVAHLCALWWISARTLSPAASAPEIAALAVRMVMAPAPPIALPPLAVTARATSTATPARPTAAGAAPSSRAAAPLSRAAPTASPSATTSPDAEHGQTGTGFKAVAPRAGNGSGTAPLNLNLDTNTYTRTPSLAERAHVQLDDAPPGGIQSGTTRITERRGGAMGYRARIQTPLGSYCLRGQDAGSRRMSDRPADNTMLPSSCD